jgi:hypothetical protein
VNFSGSGPKTEHLVRKAGPGYGRDVAIGESGRRSFSRAGQW